MKPLFANRSLSQFNFKLLVDVHIQKYIELYPCKELEKPVVNFTNILRAAFCVLTSKLCIPQA